MVQIHRKTLNPIGSTIPCRHWSSRHVLLIDFNEWKRSTVMTHQPIFILHPLINSNVNVYRWFFWIFTTKKIHSSIKYTHLHSNVSIPSPARLSHDKAAFIISKTLKMCIITSAIVIAHSRPLIWLHSTRPVPHRTNEIYIDVNCLVFASIYLTKTTIQHENLVQSETVGLPCVVNCTVNSELYATVWLHSAHIFRYGTWEWARRTYNASTKKCKNYEIEI